MVSFIDDAKSASNAKIKAKLKLYTKHFRAWNSGLKEDIGENKELNISRDRPLSGIYAQDGKLVDIFAISFRRLHHRVNAK